MPSSHAHAQHKTPLKKCLAKTGISSVPFPQRRNNKGNHIQPIKQDLLENYLLNLGFQIFIGGSNDSNIDRNGLRPPTRSNFCS